MSLTTNSTSYAGINTEPCYPIRVFDKKMHRIGIIGFLKIFHLCSSKAKFFKNFY